MAKPIEPKDKEKIIKKLTGEPPEPPIEEYEEDEEEEIIPTPITRPKIRNPKFSNNIDFSPVTEHLEKLNSNIEKLLKPKEETPPAEPPKPPEEPPKEKPYKLFDEFELKI